MKIALLDSRINQTDSKVKLCNHIMIDENGSCKTKHLNNDRKNIFMHGTYCLEIISGFFNEAEIYSITILNQHGQGDIKKLEPALEWCSKNDIRLVNLSLGTTNFQDKYRIRKIVNHYANNGMIIVAAAANSGYRTFPASFSNVIGVAAGKNSQVYIEEEGFIQIGVDFFAPSKHEVIVNHKAVRLNKSNSYAAPFITAMIGRILQHNPSFNVCELKNRVRAMLSASPFFTYYPDWIENAWVSEHCKGSKAKYYFEPVQNMEKADTYIVKNEKELFRYSKKGKHIVYLGEEKKDAPNTLNYFWCRADMVEQIQKSPKRSKDMDLPVIIFKLDIKEDEFFWLCEMRQCFHRDGYQVYAVSQTVESVLYDVGYLPHELCDQNQREIIHDYLCVQTYVHKSDAVFVSLTGKYARCLSAKEADIMIEINSQPDRKITIWWNGIEKSAETIDVVDDSTIKRYYDMILNFLLEDTNE